MKMTSRILIAMTLVIAFIQDGSSQIQQMRNYVFSQDSLRGFDEQAASVAALANHCYGDEYKVYMYRAKRSYIKSKYDLQPTPPAQTLFQNPVGRPSAEQQVGGACDNEDFELGTIQGWTVQSGNNTNSCQNPNFTGATFYTVNTSGVSDARIPYEVVSYFDAGSATVPAGSGFITLNEDNAGANAVRITKTFIPTPNSAVFQYAYLSVIEDSPHDCCDQPGFNIKVSIAFTNSPGTFTVLACPQISVAVPSSLCNYTVPTGGPVFKPCVGTTGGNWSYCDWTASAIDLTQYMNTHIVRIEVTVVDCNAGGHGAYTYFDSKCSPMTIVGNNNDFPAGTTSITLPSCGAIGATICATPGLGPYTWYGPNVPTNYSTPSMTNTCFTATLSSTYTLVMEPPGSCQPLVKIITTTNTAAPTLLANITQATCGGTLAMVSVTPAGSAQSSPQIFFSQFPFTTNSNSTTASFTLPVGPACSPLTITAMDQLGCKVTQSVCIDAPAPVPTFSLENVTNSNSITCTFPSIQFSLNTTYTPQVTYYWASNSTTFNTNPVNVTIPGTYTVQMRDPVTQCIADTIVTVPINTVSPTGTISPMTQNITCSLSSVQTVTANTTPTANVTQWVTNKTGATYSVNANTMVYSPGFPGTYSWTVRNDLNGCEATKMFTVTSSQGFPVFDLFSPDNYTLGCNTKSVATIQILNAQSTGTDQVPNGGPVTYTLLPPGASPTLSSGLLTTNSNWTVTVPGTWTVVTRDNNSSCETRLPISVLQNTFAPHLRAIIPSNILDCNTSSMTAIGQSTTQNVSFSWNFPGNPGTQAGSSLVVVTLPASPQNSVIANFTLNVFDNSSTCLSQSIIPIYQTLHPPTAIFSGTGALSCTNPSLMLTNQSISNIPKNSIFKTDQPAVGFLWQGPSPQEPISNSSSYVSKTPGVYTLTAKDLNNGCVDTYTATILDNIKFPILNNPVKPAPAILDCGANSTTLSPIITNTVANMTYTWSYSGSPTVSGVNSATLTTNTLGEYVIAVRNPSSGCISRANMQVVNGTLTAAFEPDRTEGFAPLTVNFDNNTTSTTGSSSITSIWSFGTGDSLRINNVNSQTRTFTQPGTYSVTLYARKGQCLTSITKTITVDIPSALEIPNVFTPNNDGVNDIYFLKADNLTNITMQIFDRWGHLVYEVTSTTGNVAWDGKNQAGVEQSEGTYFFVLTATGKDGQSFDKNGVITLAR